MPDLFYRETEIVVKRPVQSILFHTSIGRLFLVLWIGGLSLIVARIVWEIRTVLYGSTIVCYGKHGDYLMHIPPGFHDATHRFPLLIFLHGAGERHRPVRQLANADIVRYAGPVARSGDFPFLVVCPKTSGPRWEPDRVVGLLDELLRDDNLRWKIDPTRVYLTGFSMGGFGTFSVAAEYPDRFAAVAPVAGGGDPAKATKFARLPVWTFHGESDEIVPCEESVVLFETLRSLHPEHTENYRLTVYPDMDHGIPIWVYSDPELYRWLLRHRRETAPISPP